ncbi:hypothetical protein CDAR_192461 [Caerostris darwini]|uniref:Uncharacterized protein n=1 Tax=Caerostris darwini TaxID=1538125 RepID=A0AAV4W9H1_9ARAC|nr:hypothetical protein CDAR_192461 [Caerostris darwini]
MNNSTPPGTLMPPDELYGVTSCWDTSPQGSQVTAFCSRRWGEFIFCHSAVLMHWPFRLSSGRENRRMHPLWSTNIQMRFTLTVDDKIDALLLVGPYFWRTRSNGE